MEPFMDKYIFPGGHIPTVSELSKAFERSLVLEDFQNFGYDYVRTLEEWSKNLDVYFKENPEAHSLATQRMWDFYLKISMCHFEVRLAQLWQFVLSPRPTSRKRIQRQV
mmetsp:Transcript_75793/g.245379  ORF Transcript_75793/g.245379 Transcript_75793/m.245379 type:complete len:109 (-) Transcript_75793:99-425(-)